MKRLLLLAALVLFPIPVQAQVDRATLTGTVKDQMGAVIPGATVAVTHTGTNVTTRVRTTTEGVYLAPNLISGTYTVAAEAQGFGTQSRAVILDVGQRARIDFSLHGGGSERGGHRDRGDAPARHDAGRGGLRDRPERGVAKLPLAIRNWDDLMVLVPGVQGDRFTEESGGTAAGRTGGVNVHGNRSLQNNFLLDGVDNNSISTNVQELTTQVSRPSIDAIEEFKVVTSPYAAEYGRAPGAAISVITKSGTNALRGTGYDYFRDERFDSNTYFNEDFRTERGLPAAEAEQRPGPVRLQPRRPDPEGPALLLRRLRGHAHHPRHDAQHARADDGRARGDLHDTDPRPAHRPAVPGQRDPRGPHRPGGRRDLRAPAGAQHERDQQLRPARRQRDRRRRPHHRQDRLPRLGQEHLLPALHLHRPRAVAAGRLRRPDRRHRHLGLRRPDDHLERPRARLDAHLRPLGRERVPLLVERASTPTRCSSPSASCRRTRRRCRACPTTR